MDLPNRSDGCKKSRLATLAGTLVSLVDVTAKVPRVILKSIKLPKAKITKGKTHQFVGGLGGIQYFRSTPCARKQKETRQESIANTFKCKMRSPELTHVFIVPLTHNRCNLKICEGGMHEALTCKLKMRLGGNALSVNHC